MMVFTKDTVSPMTETVATTPAIALNTSSDQVYDKKGDVSPYSIQERIDSSARKGLSLVDFHRGFEISELLIKCESSCKLTDKAVIKRLRARLQALMNERGSRCVPLTGNNAQTYTSMTTLF